MGLYEDLGLEPDATDAEVKKAHRRKVKATHPDAGGKREDFDKVQRAFMVLSDPLKREKYDSTGQINDAPENLEESQALTILAQKLAAVMANESVNPRAVDILISIKSEMTQEAQAARGEKVKTERQIERAIEFKKRLKVKEGETNRLTQVIDGQITAHRGRIEAIEMALRVYEIAQALAKHYVYETDAPGAQDMNQQLLRAVYDQVRGPQSGFFTAPFG